MKRLEWRFIPATAGNHSVEIPPGACVVAASGTSAGFRLLLSVPKDGDGLAETRDFVVVRDGEELPSFVEDNTLLAGFAGDDGDCHLFMPAGNGESQC